MRAMIFCVCLPGIAVIVVSPICRQAGERKQKDARFAVVAVDVSVEYMYSKFVGVYPACLDDTNSQ